MFRVEQSDVNKSINEYICKGTIKKNIGKEILIVVNHMKSVFNHFKEVLMTQGYRVTIINHTQDINRYITEKTNLIYVDCCHGFALLDGVMAMHRVDIIVVAIMNEGFEAVKTMFAKHAYDYVTTSICRTELINKTTLYMLYSAACRLNIYDDKKQKHTQHDIDDKSIDLVNTACSHLLKNMSSYTSLDELCRLLGTNRNTLAIAFKNRLGMGAYSWLRNARIQKATQLLKFSTMSIQSISFEVGYENAANFSTTFKSIMGVTPKKYRKLHNQNFQ